MSHAYAIRIFFSCILWFRARDHPSNRPHDFRLISIASNFHWMNQTSKQIHAFFAPFCHFFFYYVGRFFLFFLCFFDDCFFFCRNPFQWDWCAFWSAAYNLQCNLFPIGVGFTSFAFSLRCFCIQAAEMWPFNPSFFSSARLIAVSSIYFAFYFWMFQICLVYNGHRRTVAVKRFFPP